MKIKLTNNIISTSKAISKDTGLAWVDDSVPVIPELSNHRIWRLQLAFENDSEVDAVLPGFFDAPNRVNSDVGIPASKELFYATVFHPLTGMYRREAFISPQLENYFYQSGVRTSDETPKSGNLVLAPGRGLSVLAQLCILDSTRVPDGVYELNVMFDSLTKYGTENQGFGAWMIRVGAGQVKIIAEL